MVDFLSPDTQYYFYHMLKIFIYIYVIVCTFFGGCLVSPFCFTLLFIHAPCYSLEIHLNIW